MVGTRNIFVDELKRTPVDEQRVEIVERKGLGHPDFICDSIMDAVSVELSKEYLKRTNQILHHNIDKGLLVAGEVERKFGGGKVLSPMSVIFGDRATFRIDGEQIPVKEIATNAAKKWISKNLRFVDPEKHMRYQVELRRGSEELTDIFRRGGRVLGANDTSAAVGYAPLTETERTVLELERYLNSAEFKKSYPESGEDIKVMGYRMDRVLNLTIATAFVDRFIKDEADYFRKKQDILDRVNDFLRDRTTFNNVHADVNTLDQRGRGMGGIYLTVLGTSADDADGGQVGRGNRVNGVFPLNRPVSSEAAAGKNPVSHVGKIYNLLSHRMAEQIHRKVPGLKEVYVWLLSRIGQAVDQPAIATAQLVMNPGHSSKEVEEQVIDMIESELSRIEDFCRDLAQGKIPIC